MGVESALTTGVVDLGVPFFIVVVFLLSYLLWAKFLNGGVLRINFGARTSVDKVGAILLMFMALLLTLVELPMVLPLLAAVRDLDLSASRMNTIWSSTTAQVILFALTGILVLLSVYRNKRPKKGALPNLFVFLLVMHLVTVGVVFGMLSWAMLFPVIPTLTGLLFLFFLAVLVVSLCSCMPIVFLGLITIPKHDLRRIELLAVALLVACVVVTAGWAYLSSPSYKQEPTIITAYFPSSSDYGGVDRIDAYAYKEIPLTIARPGWLGPYFNIMAIDYQTSAIEHRDGMDYTFSLTTINESGHDLLLASGVATVANYSIAVQEKRGIIALRDVDNRSLVVWFDKKTLQDNDISRIALWGVTPVVLNSTQYARHREQACDGNHCTVSVNITNRLLVQVVERDYFIANLQGQQNVSKCEFTNATYFLAEEVRGYKSGAGTCRKTDCNIYLADNDTIVSASFILENSGVRIIKADLYAPMNITFRFDVAC